jgi:hypothetical protein
MVVGWVLRRSGCSLRKNERVYLFRKRLLANRRRIPSRRICPGWESTKPCLSGGVQRLGQRAAVPTAAQCLPPSLLRPTRKRFTPWMRHVRGIDGSCPSPEGPLPPRSGPTNLSILQALKDLFPKNVFLICRPWPKHERVLHAPLAALPLGNTGRVTVTSWAKLEERTPESSSGGSKFLLIALATLSDDSRSYVSVEIRKAEVECGPGEFV